MHLAWLWPDTTSKTIKDIKTWCLINSVIGLTNLLERSFTWTRNSQQNVCTRKGKYHQVGSKLCSKSIIESDSFFITVFFFNCLFLIILYFYSFFIDLLIKEGKEKLKTIFFVFQKITQSDDLTRPINVGLRKDDDNEGKVSSLLRFFSLKQINALSFDWL